MSRLVAVVVTAVLLVLANSTWAAGHAVLVSSDPQAGADLPTTPTVVTLEFDEPLVASLSRATVTSPAGEAFGSTVSGKTMLVRLSGDATGIYRVAWKTVSQVDGHTIQGAFRFGVGVHVRGSAVEAPSATQGDVGLSVLRVIEYVLLLLACGMAVLDRVRRRGATLRQPHLPVALALLVSGILVVGAEAALAGSGLSVRGTLDYLDNGLTGWARVARLLLEALLLAVVVWRRRISALVLAGIIGAVAIAGHGADVEPAWQGMAVNAAHLAAAGIWAGGIMALAVVRMQGRWPEVRRDLLEGFSRVAPWAFATSVGLGVVQAYQLLGSPQAVLHTSYGLTLVVKASAVAAMIPLSWLAWRRTREHLRGEAALALVVTAAAAALAAFPVVPKEAREAAEAAAAATSQQPQQSALPQRGDLTMGGRAGQVMVGLTVHPARPGPNTVTVYLASPATRRTAASLDVGGRSVDLPSCGARCRTGDVELHGRQALAVHVAGQGTATFRLPRLPAADGAAVLRAAERRMDALRSYTVRENLSGFRSRYVYARPHRMYVRTWFGDGRHDTLWLGRSLYHRSRGKADWKLDSTGERAPVPYYPWYPFRPLVDARVVGSAQVAGRPASVVSTFGGHGKEPESIWFTLYVDRATGLVVRSRMWAPNHFMVDRYADFDAPVQLPEDPAASRP